MPVSVIVGGQYGSEGKGKVAYFFAKQYKAAAVVRVGGPNSGHTVITESGVPVIFKHLPTACILQGVKSVLTAGNYINLEILLTEISLSGIASSDLLIDPYAVIISQEDINAEQNGKLINSIGSTGCGLGSSIKRRISRNKPVKFAKDIPELKSYIVDTNSILRYYLNNNERVIIEGTQGFGLSLLHSNYYPYCTSRDTTAAAFISEAGLSPLDVDDIILVIRTYPIRVSGNSGPLKREIDWEKVTKDSGSKNFIEEYTSVTKKIRRVAEFDHEIVSRSILFNTPTKIVLNHLDYIDKSKGGSTLTEKMMLYIRDIESKINRRIEFIGLGPNNIVRTPILRQDSCKTLTYA